MTRGQALEDRPDRIELHELLDRNLADDGASKRRAHHETEQVEVAQRLADRRLTDAELLGDAHLDDALARRQTAVEDVFDQLVANLVAKDAALASRALGSRHFGDPFSGSA